MGRYRAPAKPSSPYITPDGFKRLQAELKHLWRVERPEVTKALAAAAAEGDCSENAEYTYRKKQLAGIDRRIRYLSKRMDHFQVIDRKPASADRVFFGAWVQIVDGQDKVTTLRIVGSDETDAKAGWISVDSPMARALLGKGCDETFDVVTPSGAQSFEVLAISFAGPEEF